jgi:hypothetical protein
MATTTVETVDISQALATVLEDLDGLRVYWYVSDAVRPPAVVIMQPSVDYLDAQSHFCAATWTFPVVLCVTRANEREAQIALSKHLQLVTSALGSAQIPGVLSVDPVDARPTTVTVSGVDLPGYAINVRVRA